MDVVGSLSQTNKIMQGFVFYFILSEDICRLLRRLLYDCEKIDCLLVFQ